MHIVLGENNTAYDQFPHEGPFVGENDEVAGENMAVV